MFSWTISNEKNRGPMWYIFAIIIILVLVIYGIISGLYLMSVVAVLFSGVFLLIENNTLPTTRFFINEKHLQIDNTPYTWENFSHFSIVDIGNRKILKLFPLKKFSPVFEIPLNSDINSAELYNFLKNFLEEKEGNNSSLDAITEITKI